MNQRVPSRPSLELPAWLWLWLPLVLLAGVGASHFLGREVYMRVVFSEWGVVENLTVVLLVVAVIVGVRLLLARQFPDRWLGMWVAVLTMGCFYFAGEEASWGQHIIGWATPESWAAINDQHETNIHNMVGTGLFDQVPRMALAICALVGGVIVPFLRRRNPDEISSFWRVRPWFWATLVCAPSAILALCISVPGKLAAKLGAEIPHIIRIAPGECKELYLALFLMLYMFSLSKRMPMWNSAAAPTPPIVTRKPSEDRHRDRAA